MCVCVRSIRNSCCYRKGDKIHKWAHKILLESGGNQIKTTGSFWKKGIGGTTLKRLPDQ